MLAIRLPSELEDRLENLAKATGRTTDQGTHDQCDHDMHAGQAEYQHDADRGNYSINHRYLKTSAMSSAGSLQRAASGS